MKPDWPAWQTILMLLGLGIPIVAASVSAYVSVKSELAVHGTRLEVIGSNVEKVERNLATLTDKLLSVRKAER